MQGESSCLPCLNKRCQDAIVKVKVARAENEEKRAKAKRAFVNGSEDDLCSICYTESLAEQPCVRLACKHIFHASCLHKMITYGSNSSSLKIQFGHLDCPACKKEIQLKYEVSLLGDELKTQSKAKAEVQNLARKTAVQEGLHRARPVLEQGSSFYGKPVEYAMYQCNFYKCFHCKKPYFGGMRNCEEEAMAQGNDIGLTKEDLDCGVCQ